MKRFKRLVKHLWADESSTRRVLPPDALGRLEQQVRDSERKHSGEIRICVETALPLSYLYRNTPTPTLARERAIAMFSNLGVWDTANNNGVLIYVLAVEQAIEIVADRALNSWMQAADWNHFIAELSGAFRREDYEGGLARALAEVSTLLAQHFPLSAEDINVNELPDAPVIL